MVALVPQEKQSMRRTLVLMALALPLCAQPAFALDRLALPGDAESPVIRAADLDRPLHTHSYRPYRADSYWYWRYRATYSRWMYNESVRAGYPVQHRQFRTYERFDACCRGHRHW
jgi:hypothetical protein